MTPKEPATSAHRAAPRREPYDNRVTPAGELIAVTARGTFMGNRGVVHDRDGRVVRHHRGRVWAICRTEFNGRWRAVRTPGRLTEMFFLDEAVALAAGHRPCGMCRHDAFHSYKTTYRTVTGHPSATAADIDDRLHRERLGPGDVHRTWQGQLATLPDGAFVDLDGGYWLVRGDHLLEWTASGYAARRARTGSGVVTVRTPPTTCAVLAAGYAPVLHPSAAPRP